MSSIPFVPGQYLHVANLPGLFIVIAFEGRTYRLRSQLGAELEAGGQTMSAASDQTQRAPNEDSQEGKPDGR